MKIGNSQEDYLHLCRPTREGSLVQPMKEKEKKEAEPTQAKTIQICRSPELILYSDELLEQLTNSYNNLLIQFEYFRSAYNF